MEAAVARLENQTFSHYRMGTLGQSLETTLLDLVAAGLITVEQMSSCLIQFDVEMNKQLGNAQDPMFMHMNGSISTYRNAENVWTWDLSEAKMHFGLTEKSAKKGEEVEVKTMRVVAIDAFPGRVGSRAGRKKGAVPGVAGAAKVIKQPRKKKLKKEEKE